MPPNANSVGGPKKKNKKNHQRPQQQHQQTQPQPLPEEEQPENPIKKDPKPEVLEEVVEKNREEDKEKVEETVAPTIEKEKNISGDLLDFSSSDKSSLSSRPDSPEEDEDAVPVVNRTTTSPPTSPPSQTAVEQDSLQAEEMLVDMSLDDAPAAPPRKPHQRSAPPPIPSMNTIMTKPRTNSVSYIKGQVVRQSAVEQQTLANQVVDLVAMGMSKGQTQSSQITAEKAEWVQLTSVEKAGEPNERLEVLIVGLCRGYQIWTMSMEFQQSGEFEEVLSERQGPVRALKVLPNNLKLRGKKDSFADSRPLIAMVDASSHHPDRQYCSVTIISLLTGREVHKIKFEEPVCAVNVSDQFLVVSLANMAYAYDILTFNEVRTIRTAPSCENSPPALSLSCQLLAYADTSLDLNLQSSGGLAAEVEATSSEKYTDHIYTAMSYFSRSVKTISESVGAGSGSSTKANQPQGVITVLNLAVSGEDESDGVMCHYVAHVDPISYIAFSPDQRLVLSADANANVFNIFLLMPHATSSSLAAVQHLYKLNRGSTPAKVVSTAFSEDCRWLAITTNHATTHVFAVCPFGGKPNQRTHGDTFVNKESRFHRSAGLTDAADVTASIGPSKHRAMADSCSYTKEHPIAVNSPTLAKTNGNSRVGPFPPPLLLVATEKIKDSRYTKEDLSAWAADMTSFSYPAAQASSSPAVAARRRLEVSRMSVMFRMKSYNSTTSTKTAKTTKMLMSMSLVIAKVDPAQGVIVTQHDIKSLRKEGETNMEASPQISVAPVGGWILQRTKNNADMHAPMPSASPLMAFATVETVPAKRIGDEDVWTPHVETRTYLPPHRWIWQGPQFELFEYREDDQPSLMSPGNKGSNASFKSIPVLVGSEAVNITMKTIPADATRIECGSYTSANSYSIDQGSDQPVIGGYSSATNGDYIASIADAMRDISSDDDSTKKKSPKNDDLIEEFFDTESSTPFARNGSGSSSSTGATGGKSLKKKKTPPASAPLPTSSTKSSQKDKKVQNGRERSKDSDDFGTFDMDDI
ncbi:BCAS3 WD40 domain-containing protein [Caenorhabditis elegans]|uniref:BCAS3 WD40 domain-containing protein n=1 Tax=Caenorhabditis elegans TaxID=6239 RepID=A0A486WX46_CAEEL|nr:BCAS3 domain-containing protein [Caenorhabditis elegans]VGM69501.1 BCAS3 domain-containing protein [Caenorhabditis elegans]